MMAPYSAAQDFGFKCQKMFQIMTQDICKPICTPTFPHQIGLIPKREWRAGLLPCPSKILEAGKSLRAEE